MDGCILSAKKFADNRGELFYIQGQEELPFDIARVFWITNVPEGAERGGHAHWRCSEAIFPLSGGFDIYLDDGFQYQVLTLDHPEQGVLVKAGVWCVLRNFKPGTVCMVAASMEYDQTGYVNDYQTFLEQVRCR